MQKSIPDFQAQHAVRLGYLWLVLGTSLALFAANEHWDVSLPAWFAPLFFLRFSRTRRNPFIGIGGVWLASSCAMIFFLYESQLLNSPLLIVCLLLSTILTLPYLLDRLIAPRLSQTSGFLATLVFPLSRVIFEYFIALTPFGNIFSLAYTQAGNLVLLQMLSVTGVYGVSFLLTWFASVWNWMWEQHFSWPRIRAVTLLYGGLLVLVLAYGSIRLAWFSPSAQTVRVAGVSVPSSLHHLAPTPKQMALLARNNPAQLRSTLTTYNQKLLDESRVQAQAGAKIIVWPEVGALTLAVDEASLIGLGQAVARSEHIYLEMGIGVFQPPNTYRDEALLLDPEGRVDWTYNKAYPIPGMDPFAPGDGIVPVADTPYGRLANVICFDADFPGLMQRAGSQQVDIMLVPSNDWQGIDPWHTQHATFRAIENGYSLVRQASNGLAMTVDYQGHVLAASDYYTTDRQTMIASVPIQGVWTIYAAVGDLFAWLCVAGFLLLAGFAACRALLLKERS